MHLIIYKRSKSSSLIFRDSMRCSQRVNATSKPAWQHESCSLHVQTLDGAVDVRLESCWLVAMALFFSFPLSAASCLHHGPTWLCILQSAAAAWYYRSLCFWLSDGMLLHNWRTTVCGGCIEFLQTALCASPFKGLMLLHSLCDNEDEGREAVSDPVTRPVLQFQSSCASH